MTRYLIGRRMGGSRPSNLQVVDKPPMFYKPKAKNEPEHIAWAGSNFGWRARRDLVHEWHDDGAAVVARIFPEEWAGDVATADAAVADARAALEQALRLRQELLDTIVSRAKPVRVAAAKRERTAFTSEHREGKP